MLIEYLKIPCKEYSCISQSYHVFDSSACHEFLQTPSSKAKYSLENPCLCSLHFTSSQNKTYELEFTSVTLLTDNKGPPHGN